MSPEVEELLRVHKELRTVLKRTVRAVMARGSFLQTNSILQIRMRGRTSWTLQDWIPLLEEVEQCDKTIEDWLTIESLL